MKMNRDAIDPFNDWWRQIGGHCMPPPNVVKAFDAGFKAGIEHARQVVLREASTENP